MKPAEAKAILPDANQMLKGWEEIRQLFNKAVATDQVITTEEERIFLDLKSTLSRLLRALVQPVPKDLAFSEKAVGEFLKQCVSLQHLRTIPEVDRPQLVGEWHKNWIALVRMAGGIEFIAEGWVPVEKKGTGGQSIASIKKGGKGKKSKKKLVTIVLLLILAGAAAWYFMQ